MLLVNALAGVGKTSVAMWGLGVPVPKGIVLSSEQLAIVKRIRSYSWEKAAAMAFNVLIAKELKSRVPPGVEAATTNAFGYRAWLKHIDRKKIGVSQWKTANILKSISEEGYLKEEELRRYTPDISKIVSLLKSNLLDWTTANIKFLGEKYDVEVDEMMKMLVVQVMEESVTMEDEFDFDDQIFMPIHKNISFPKFDLIVCDESQDLSPAKQEMAFRSLKEGGNLVAIGDRFQAIYGFSGANAAGMDTLADRMRALGNFIELPLTVTRRCPKAVVVHANKYVPALKAHSDAIEGEVRYTNQSGFVDELVAEVYGRMILCRTNAPLTGLAFKLLREDRACYIQGREIGQGLKKILVKTKEPLLVDAIPKGLEKIKAKIVKLEKSHAIDTNKIEALKDQVLCIEYLAEDLTTVEEFCKRIDILFQDESNNDKVHQLSTVHKAKGLEKKHVCIYIPSTLPMRRKRKPGRTAPRAGDDQENNLAYVAFTRAQEILTFVVEDVKKN